MTGFYLVCLVSYDVGYKPRVGWRMSSQIWFLSSEEYNMMLERPKHYFLKDSQKVSTGTKEQFDIDGVFNIPIQQWIDGACERSDPAWQDCLKPEDECSCEYASLQRYIILLKYENLILIVDELLRSLHWQYDYT